MGLPEHGCLVSRCLNDLGKGHIGGVKLKMVVHLSVEMRMLSGQDGGATWGTDGIGHAGIGKQHAHFGNPVNIRRLDQCVVICGNGLVGMVIRHDKDDIWPSL